METVDLVQAAINGDKESFINAFNASISAKIADALEVKKVEVASNLLDVRQKEETPNELETTEVETAGAESVDDTENVVDNSNSAE